MEPFTDWVSVPLVCSKVLTRFVSLLGEAIGIVPQDSEQTRALREFARVMLKAVNE